ncbi:4Fe-4S dicluster domain-containing protein [Candidatus Bathyarchaeota archaeon]|nr:4Fe-4S dicluster domain-containing protein [Candidatus Bathyarchaeota archaeon]
MDRRFYEKVRDLSGEEIDLCYQCGICSGSCPMASEMDILPSTLIRLVQLGQTEVLESETIWLCSSCFTCSVRCPRGIDIAKVAEALRQMKLRKDVDYVHLNKIPKDERERLPQIALVSNFRKFTA